MSKRPADLHSELRRLAAEDLAAAGDHPPPEDLMAYHRRSLPEPRAEELREHLAVCAECTALLLDFDEHWARGAGAETESAYEPWYSRGGPLRAIAAGLGALALGLAGWIAFHPPVEPGAGSAYRTRNLEPVTAGMRSGSGDSPIRVPETAEIVVLTLEVRDIGDPDAGVLVATLRLGDEVVDRVENTLDEAGEFALAVPAGTLRPGDWEVGLRDPEGIRPEHTYRFSVAPPGEPGAER